MEENILKEKIYSLKDTKDRERKGGNYKKEKILRDG